MTYATVGCCCCEWKGRTHRYPGHLLGHHLAQIQRVMSVGDHCLYFGIGETDCYVCLTCEHGTTHTGVGRIGDRWSEMHSQKKECRHAHPDAYSRFKALWTAARGSVIAAEKEAATVALAKAEAAVAVSAAGGVGELWNKHRGNRHLKEYMLEVEERMKEEHSLVDEDEDPTPFVFDPAEAFERTLAEVMSVRKEVTLTKQKMSEMVVAHDAELTTHRAELLRLGRESTGLWERVTDQAGRLLEQSVEVKSLREEVAALRKQLGMAESG